MNVMEVIASLKILFIWLYAAYVIKHILVKPRKPSKDTLANINLA